MDIRDSFIEGNVESDLKGSCRVGSTFFDYKHADQKLKFVIGILNGNHIGSSRKGRVHLALIAKDELKEHGFFWHCKIIDFHIHRTAKLEQIPAGSDSQQSKREGSLKTKISFEQWLEGLI